MLKVTKQDVHPLKIFSCSQRSGSGTNICRGRKGASCGIIYTGCTSCAVTLSIQLPPGSQADNISLLPISPHKEDHHRLTIIDSKLKFMINKICTLVQVEHFFAHRNVS